MMRPQRAPRKGICRKPLQRLRLGAYRRLRSRALREPPGLLWRGCHKSLFHNNLGSSLALGAGAQKGRRFLLIPGAEGPITGLET